MLEWLLFGSLAVVTVLVAIRAVHQVWHGTRVGHDWTTDDRGYVCLVCGARPWID